jgi:deoxyadenosine/deoxycytidine kinase
MSYSNYIAIAGNMGSGKTSLANFLTRKLGIKSILEPQDENPYIKDFYSDMKKWAFHSQLFFLAKKIQFYNTMEEVKDLILLDRTIYEDAEIFATALYRKRFISSRDFRLYRLIYSEAMKKIKPPRLLIYCHCSTHCILQRIARRGRDYESKVDRQYISYLNRLYAKWRESYNLSPVLDLNTEKMDYFSNFLDRLDILNEVKKYI